MTKTQIYNKNVSLTTEVTYQTLYLQIYILNKRYFNLNMMSHSCWNWSQVNIVLDTWLFETITSSKSIRYP